MYAARIHRHGGPEVIQIDELPPPTASSQTLIDVAFAGANYVDIYQREGRYPGISLPLTLGIEAAGRVRQTLAGSRHRVGTRVAVAGLVQGAYADVCAVPDNALVAIPDDISLLQAATCLEQGLTADVLIRDVARISSNDRGWAMVHAGAGGVGRWLVKRLLALGVSVVATASTDAKCQRLREWGAVAVRSDGDQWQAAARDATGGTAPRWVFDSVGLATFDRSLALLAERGHLILYGAASGPVAPIDPVRLMSKSATLSRPVLPHYLRDPDALQQRADATFALLRSDASFAQIGASLSLADAAQAHVALQSRSREGKVLIEIGGEE